uniref:Retrovirus-related Pol polyprotein from transposon TNT 1-94 n=1 Tax=Nelumbo nucifera TaxID=4432 RepID=A0A822Z261_NELNU|nr:TPA_asm: hypothetical protein HUJ06_012915 [Nelumbo nucifera]
MTKPEHLLKMRNIVDALAAADQPMSEMDLVLIVLGGLGADYAALTTTITVRASEYTFDEVQALLLNHEIRLDNSKFLVGSSVMTANIVAKDGKGSRPSPSYPRPDENKPKIPLTDTQRPKS